MRIDPTVENPTRTMLAHAVQGELDALSGVARGLKDGQRFHECLELCGIISGYVAVDVLGPAWPTDAGLRRMAEKTAKAEDEHRLDVTQIHDYLWKSAVGFQGLDRVFSTEEELARWPIVITASLLLTFCPRGKEIWAYLDEIEEALEMASAVKPSAYPAMILMAHSLEASKTG